MKRASGVLIIFLCSLNVLAQQDAMYSQYMFNTLAINPAYAGSRNILSGTALFRRQWVGIAGAPETKTISFDMPMSRNRLGLGIQAFNDKIGVTNLSGAFLSYAFRIFMERSTLAFGLQTGVSHFKADFTSVNLGGQGPDQAFLQNIDRTILNFGSGIYFNTDRLYVGISVPHLLNNTIDNNSVSVTNGLVAPQHLHLFVALGYVFNIGEDFKVKPSFLFKGIQGAPVQVDLSTNLWVKDTFGIGAQYRTNSNIAAMIEMQISPQIRMGYSYDRSVTRLANFNSGSHEIMLRYEFSFQKDGVLSPRYF